MEDDERGIVAWLARSAGNRMTVTVVFAVVIGAALQLWVLS